MGRLLITRGAAPVLSTDHVLNALRRHLDGDWGDVCELDRETNDEALQSGGRLFSVYHADSTRFWVITEADRSATTILLPEEY
jgi:hypothetical protein